MPVEELLAQPRVAGQLSVFDCAGVADGTAAAVVVRADDAHRFTDRALFVKGVSFVVGDGRGVTDPAYDYTTFPEVVASATDRVSTGGSHRSSAGAGDGRGARLLHAHRDGPHGGPWFPRRGQACRDVLSGAFDLSGELPVNPDGGLKSFGHPVGASGLRMMFEAWLQLPARPLTTARSPPSATGTWPSLRTWAAIPARWCHLCRSSGPSGTDPIEVKPIGSDRGTVVEVLDEVASAHPDTDAYVDGGQRLTYGALAARTRGWAEVLAEHGMGRGDVLAIRLPSSVEYAVAYLGALRLGVVATGINPRLGRREVEGILARCSPAATIIADEDEPDGVGGVMFRRADVQGVGDGDPSKSRARISPEDSVAIVWTSGTTGQPKGAIFDHRRLEALARATGELSLPFDRRISPVPFAHVGYITASGTRSPTS